MRAICAWLGYGEIPVKGSYVKDFQRREFSARVQNWDEQEEMFTEEVFKRFISYKDECDLKKFLQGSRLIHRIDIGAIWDDALDRGYALRGKPGKREFVLDIDLTDMSDVIFTSKNDPSDSSFKFSWRFLQVAMEILDSALINDFGCKHIFRMFSGRRGIHYWVCDENVLSWTDETRKAVVKYLSINKRDFKVNTQSLHPFFERAAEIILQDKAAVFCKMVEEQGWFNPECVEKTLSCIEEKSVAKEIMSTLLCDNGDGTKMWRRFCNVVANPRSEQNKEMLKGTTSQRKTLIHNFIRRFAIRMVYPVLDIAVSEKRNHLLRLPFSVHSTTGMLCVPVNKQMHDAPLVSATAVNCDPNLLRPHVKEFRTTIQPLYVERMKARLNNSLEF